MFLQPKRGYVSFLHITKIDRMSYPTKSQLASQVHNRSKELGDTQCTSFLGHVFGHLLDQL
jgi:hypothetical protein